jgi:hypothetical protein
MSQISDLRKAIKAQFPDLQFTIKTVSFSDLARADRVFVKSNAWGMCIGNQELYHAVEAIAKQYNAIVSF